LDAKRAAEQTARQADAVEAQRQYNALEARLQHEAASPTFDAMKRDLKNAHEEWQGLGRILNTEIETIRANAKQRQ
jgi:hypothetical protein